MLKRFQGFLIGIIVAIALPVFAYKVTDTNIIFGENGDVTLKIGGGQIKWNNTEGRLEKSNDGGATLDELGASGRSKLEKIQILELKLVIFWSHQRPSISASFSMVISSPPVV